MVDIKAGRQYFSCNLVAQGFARKAEAEGYTTIIDSHPTAELNDAWFVDVYLEVDADEEAGARIYDMLKDEQMGVM
jgi:hypothetical protein